MRRRQPLCLALVLSLAAPGCFVFDESLYRAREDAAIEEVDGGLTTIALADDCRGPVPELSLGVTRAFDTSGLSNDYANLGCTGRPQPGPDGFFSVTMAAGERWHFHIRRSGMGADPVIFALDGMCLDLECDPPNALDACRADSDEHLSIHATTSGTYYVGIDSGGAAGFAGRVEVYRPVCGDGAQTHGESCEPGVTAGVECTNDCRARLLDGGAEHEVNDDAFMANLLELPLGETITIRGRIGALCENDVFAIDVPAGGGSIAAALLTAGGAECPSGTLSSELQLLGTDGIVVRGEGTVRAGFCPSIDASDVFATRLPMGRYFVRIYALNDTVVRPFDYQLRISLAP